MGDQLYRNAGVLAEKLSATWKTGNHVLGQGLQEARTLVDLQRGAISVRAVNISDKPVHLPKGTLYSELKRAMKTVEGPSQRNTEPDEDPHMVRVQPVLEWVDDEVPAEKQQYIRTAYRLVCEQTKRCTKRRDEQDHFKVNELKPGVGDWIWHLYPQPYTARSPEWQRFYGGTFLVAHLLSSTNCVIQRGPKMVAHVEQLKLYRRNVPLSWVSGHAEFDPGTPVTTPKGMGNPSSMDRLVETESDVLSANFDTQRRGGRLRQPPERFVW